MPRESYREILELSGFKGGMLDKHATYMSSGRVTAWLVYRAEKCFATLGSIMGEEAPAIAKVQTPNSIRALFGEDLVKNAVYFTKNIRAYKKTLPNFFFDEKSIHPTTVSHTQSISVIHDQSENISQLGNIPVLSPSV